MNKFDEEAIQRLEEMIPELAAIATARAYHQALASGHKVLIVEDGELKEVSPDGTKRFLKKVALSSKTQKGQVIKIDFPQS